MSDIFTREKRSAVMARIRGAGNKATELRLIALMRAARITGWRRNSTLFGRPDFVFPKRRLAVFVDGCFWHGCPLHATQPKQNAEFWRKKIARNQARDRLVTRTLRQASWDVLRVWEHELKKSNQHRLLARLALAQSAAMGKRAAKNLGPRLDPLKATDLKIFKTSERKSTTPRRVRN